MCLAWPMDYHTSKLWKNPATRRYYRVIVAPDLFGELNLIRVWGSLDNARGNHKTERLADWQEVNTRLEQISKERRRKGYQPVPSG